MATFEIRSLSTFAHISQTNLSGVFDGEVGDGEDGELHSNLFKWYTP